MFYDKTKILVHEGKRPFQKFSMSICTHLFRRCFGSWGKGHYFGVKQHNLGQFDPKMLGTISGSILLIVLRLNSIFSLVSYDVYHVIFLDVEIMQKDRPLDGAVLSTRKVKLRGNICMELGSSSSSSQNTKCLFTDEKLPERIIIRIIDTNALQDALQM